MAPRAGKLHGDAFYRAAWTVLDVHRWVAVAEPLSAPARIPPSPASR